MTCERCGSAEDVFNTDCVTIETGVTLKFTLPVKLCVICSIQIALETSAILEEPAK